MPMLAALAGAGGCGVDKNNVLAPTDAVLSIRADTTFLSANSSTSLTVGLRRTNGNPAPEGTEILVSTTLGELDQKKVRIRNGEATVLFRSGPTAGTARITATSGSVTAELSIPIGSAAPGVVSLVASPTVLPAGGGEVTIVATVSAATGTLVSGAPVSFSATTGSLSPTSAVTNERGEARTTLSTSASATVRASVQGLEASTLVRLRDTTTIRVSTSPAEPTAGEAATISASMTTSDSRPASGRLRVTFGDGQTRDLGTVSGSATTSYTWASDGGFNLSAEFTDQDGFATRETIRVTVRAKASPAPTPQPGPTPAPTPTPTPSPGGGRDDLDARQVTWLHTDVSGWPITSTVTDVSISSSEICVDHTKAGRFPTSQFGSIQVEGNVWVFANINGRWYGATYDWLRPGQVCKGVTGRELGPDQIRIAPMDASWPGPRSGETVGFMVSTRARDGVPAGQERTNIVLVRWP